MKDLQSIIEGREVRPAHPGAVLADIFEDMEINQTSFAKTVGVSRRSINEIIQGRRSITVDMAIRIGKALGNGPELWINLQQKIDIWDAMQANKEEYEKVPCIV